MTGYVSPATQAAGSPVATSLLNSYKTALDTFANPAAAQLYQGTATTTVANSTSTWTPITFDTELSDTAGGHSTVTNTARYVCQTGWSGRYLVQGTVYFTGNATGVLFAGVGVNGVTPQIGSVNGFGTSPNSGTLAVETSAEVILTTNDYVQLLALQSSGGGLATVIALQITSSLTVRWVAAA